VPTAVSEPLAPPRELRRASWRRAPFAALDFETTGLDRGRDAVVAFGVVPVDGARVRYGEGLERYVAAPVPSSSRAIGVHHILPRDLLGAPTMEEARGTLAALLHGRFLITWFADVEVAFLARIFDTSERRWRRRTVDVRQMALALEGKRRPGVRYSLSAVAERYGVPVARPHEALEDALVTAQLFLVLAARLEVRGRGSVRALLRLTRG
jgi:DNA polymerase-3 subunit epsilon